MRQTLLLPALLLILLLILLLPCIAFAETFAGKVIGVSDGDTITVLRDKKPIKIRLHGVDCPEMTQPHGKKAKQFTSKKVFGKVVSVEVKTKARNGRTVGKVIIAGQSLNAQLVWAGLAWWYRKYAPLDGMLGKFESSAKRRRRGLWADDNPIAPWDWRRGVRRVISAEEALGVFHGDVRSRVFHWSSCKHYRCKHCTEMFMTAQAAIKAGYHPHTCIEAAILPAVTQPPKLPWSKERICKVDRDCVFARRNPCQCPPCGAAWRSAVNRRSNAHRTSASCRRPMCPACATHWLGNKAVCVKGQCTVTGLPAKIATKTVPTECSKDSDCAVARVRAGGCGTAMPKTRAGRIRRETARLCASGKGPRERCGKMPGCTPGHILRRAVCRQGRCVGDTRP